MHRHDNPIPNPQMPETEDHRNSLNVPNRLAHTHHTPHSRAITISTSHTLPKHHDLSNKQGHLDHPYIQSTSTSPPTLTTPQRNHAIRNPKCTANSHPAAQLRAGPEHCIYGTIPPILPHHKLPSGKLHDGKINCLQTLTLWNIYRCGKVSLSLQTPQAP